METSLDGTTWTVRQHLVALPWYWWNGHPKHDDDGRVSLYFEPVDARHLRVRLLQDSVGWNWSVAEIFVRAADVPETTSGLAEFTQGMLAERRGFMGINYHSIHAALAPDADSTPWGEVMADYRHAIRADPDNVEFSHRLSRALWINGFIGSDPSGRDALRYEALGLADLAAREFRACAENDSLTSLCADRALSHAADDAARGRLEALRNERFTPATPLDASFGPVRLLGHGPLPDAVKPGATLSVPLFWKCVGSMGAELFGLRALRRTEPLPGRSRAGRRAAADVAVDRGRDPPRRLHRDGARKRSSRDLHGAPSDCGTRFAIATCAADGSEPRESPAFTIQVAP